MNRSSQLPTTSPSRGRQPGFTVMELLIVVAVMGVLLALLLPAVQKARASARRAACQNKLRQISLAIHGFETSHGAFPAGKSRRSPVEAYDELSWLRQILPYAEQAAVWSLSERALKVEPFPYFNPPHEPLGFAIPLFACPDDSRVSVPQSASQLNGAFAGLTSCLGVMGSDYRSQDGSLVLGKRIRFADITDGTSNTVMIGERPPTPDYNYGWWYRRWGRMVPEVSICCLAHEKSSIQRDVLPNGIVRQRIASSQAPQTRCAMDFISGAFMMVVLISRSAMDPFVLWPTNRLPCLNKWQHAMEVKVLRNDLHSPIAL